MRKRPLKKTVVLWFTLFFGLVQIGYFAPQSYALAIVKSRMIDYTKNIDIQHGDFIFQHLPGELTEMIADVSEGQYSHCGIIIEKKGKFYVLEAIGPVKETPINEWIVRGIKGQFTVVRLRPEYYKNIPKIIEAAYQYLGRSYDIQYEFDDKKIYCSELIYKAAYEGAGIRLGKIERLGDMKWQPYEAVIRDISGGDLPLDREMITPEAVALAPEVQVVYSSFPAKARQGVYYSEEDMAGEWEGVYVLVDVPLRVYAHVDGWGRILSGRIQTGLIFDDIRLKSFNHATGEFQYIVRSPTNVKVVVHGRVDHSRDGIYGSWKDGLGYSGTFHLRKK